MLKKLVVLLLIVSICFTFFLLPACKRQSEGELNARMEGSTLTWDAYDGAVSYLVSCTLAEGGYSITVKDTSFLSPYTTPGEYSYVVFAKDAKGNVIAKSKPVTYHLGTGEAADAVLIGSATDLKAITESYQISFGKTKVDAPVYYRLTADIDLTGVTFTPIGTSSKPFRGVLDGAGHKIKGLTITKCNTDGNVGLFGYAKNAIIRNLTLEDASLSFSYDSLPKNSSGKVSTGELNCGLLIGHAVSSLVDNCHVTGNVDILPRVITIDNYILSAGGIVGKAESGRISCVSFEGDVSAQYGRTYAGGIVGFANGDAPNFMLLNAAAVADVSAVGTSYNTTSNASYAYARAGVLIGNLSHAGRLASLVAIGTANASSTVDGTPVSNITTGAIGRAKTDTNTLGIPTFYLYYSDTLQKAVGNLDNVGATYSRYIFPLSEEDLKNKESYHIDGDRYGLDFDNYWTIGENSAPTLKKVASAGEQPALELTLRSEVTDKEFDYRMNLEDAFTPSYFDINLLESSKRALGYNIDEILEGIGSGITSLYSDDQLEQGVKVKFSAEGVDDLIITLKKSTLKCYLVYGVHSVYEAPADIYGGFWVVDATGLKEYDFTNAKKITITFLAVEGAEA